MRGLKETNYNVSIVIQVNESKMRFEALQTQNISIMNRINQVQSFYHFCIMLFMTVYKLKLIQRHIRLNSEANYYICVSLTSSKRLISEP